MKIHKYQIEEFEKFKDKELIKILEEHELIDQIRSAILGCISIRKPCEPISIYISESQYKKLCLFYLRIGGNTQWISNKTNFIKTINEYKQRQEIKRIQEKELKLWETEA